MIRRVLLLVGGSVAFWLLVGQSARHLGGDDTAIIDLGTGLLLCLVPGAVTLVWGERVMRRSPNEQLILMMGGTGVRMAFVLLTGWMLFQGVPYYRRHGFLIWLVVCYLFTLALDLTLLLAGRPQARV